MKLELEDIPGIRDIIYEVVREEIEKQGGLLSFIRNISKNETRKICEDRLKSISDTNKKHGIEIREIKKLMKEQCKHTN